MPQNLLAISAFGALLDIFVTGFIGINLELPLYSEINFFFHAYPYKILTQGLEVWKALGYYAILWLALTMLIHYLLSNRLNSLNE